MSKVAPFAEKAGEAEDTTPAWQLKLVNFLNPKLKNFTNPVRLAAAIIVTSVIIFALVLTFYIQDCPVITGGPMALAPMIEIEHMAREGMIACVQMVMTFNTAGSTGTVEHCQPGDLSSMGLTWCESHINIEDGTPVDQSAHDYHKGSGVAACTPSDPGSGDLFAFYYDQRVCRDSSTAFALALGYTAYIEMVSTVLIIVLFQYVCKCSQSKDKSKGIMAVADNEDNKDFGSELVSRNEVKKIVSEYMAAMEMSPKLLGNKPPVTVVALATSSSKRNDWTPEPEAKSG